MKHHNRFWFLVFIFSLTCSLFSVPVAAESYAGQIVGVDCARDGQLCPTDKFEQHISDEPQFVLLDADKRFYLLGNISRDTLVRYVSNRVIIAGTLNETGNRINVTELKVLRGDALSHYESVWQAMYGQ